MNAHTHWLTTSYGYTHLQEDDVKFVCHYASLHNLEHTVTSEGFVDITVNGRILRIVKPLSTPNIRGFGFFVIGGCNADMYCEVYPSNRISEYLLSKIKEEEGGEGKE